jgi:hypothetical protein
MQLSNQFWLPHFTIPFLFLCAVQWIFYPQFVPRNIPPMVGANNRGGCINPNPHSSDGDKKTSQTSMNCPKCNMEYIELWGYLKLAFLYYQIIIVLD